ncbi:MAG: hypothetical protein Q4Q03_02370 [Bowdeniella nasicola]|nr:hypothetical protein [Bowdeniella nasicola]
MVSPITSVDPGHRAPVFRLVDVDNDGRVLAAVTPAAIGNAFADLSAAVVNTTQLCEFTRKGRLRLLTATNTEATGRYIPGRRTVLVQHYWRAGGARQLSLLNLVASQLPAGLEGFHLLAHDQGVHHRLLHAHSAGFLYLAQPGDRYAPATLLFRPWMSAAREIAHDLPPGVMATCSDNGKHFAYYNPATATAHIIRPKDTITVDMPAAPTSLRLLPDGEHLYFTTASRAYVIREKTLRRLSIQVISGGFSHYGDFAIIRGEGSLQLVAKDASVLHSWQIKPTEYRHAIWAHASSYCAVDAGVAGAWRISMKSGKRRDVWPADAGVKS